MPDTDRSIAKAIPPNETTALSRRAAFALLLITVVGGVLRVYGLARFSLWYDEGTTMYAADLAAQPLRLFNPDWLTEPPLLPILIHVWVRVLESVGFNLAPGSYQTDFLIRLVPCAFSIAAIPAAFAVARRLTGSTANGLIVAGLMALSPFHIFYAQEVRPYATMTVFVLGAIWFLNRALETNRAAHWAGSTLLLAVAMYNHFFTIWYIASLGLAVCAIAIKRGIPPRWVLSQIALLIVIVPAIGQGMTINEIISHVKSSWYPPLTAMTGLITVKTLFAGYSPRVWAYYALLTMGLALAAYGAWQMRRRTESAVILLVVGLVPIVGNLIIWSTRSFSYYEHRLFIICGVLLLVLVANGLMSIRPRGIAAILGGFWMAFTAPCLLDYYAQRIHPSEQHRLGVRYKVANRDVSNIVRSELRDGDVVGHFSHVTYFPLKSHYLPQARNVTLGFTDEDRRGMLAAYPHTSVWEHAEALPQRVDTIASRYKRLWYVESWWEPFDPPQSQIIYREWLDRHAQLAAAYDRFGVRLRLYDFAAMRGADMRVEQFADAGDVTIPRYIDATGAQMGTTVSMLPDAGAWNVRRTSDGGFIVRNNGTNARTFQWRLYANAEVIEPLALIREHPERDVWKPVFHGDPNFFDTLDPIKESATVAHGQREPAAVCAMVHLQKGSYRVGAYVWREIGPANGSRAVLRFSAKNTPLNAAPETLIGEVTPWSASGAGGWQWIELASFESSGGAVELRVTASCPSELESAYADLGRIVFVPAENVDKANLFGPLVLNEPFAVAPGKEISFDIRKFFDAGSRYDVFVEDTASHEVRYVSWYVD